MDDSLLVGLCLYLSINSGVLGGVVRLFLLSLVLVIGIQGLMYASPIALGCRLREQSRRE